MCPFSNNTLAQIIATPKATQISKETSWLDVLSSVMGFIRAAVPSIIRMLKTFEPIILPMTIPACFLRAAMMLVESSGKDVPNATILNAITESGTPTSPALTRAPLTRNSAPTAMQVRPINSVK